MTPRQKQRPKGAQPAFQRYADQGIRQLQYHHRRRHRQQKAGGGGAEGDGGEKGEGQPSGQQVEGVGPAVSPLTENSGQGEPNAQKGADKSGIGSKPVFHNSSFRQNDPPKYFFKIIRLNQNIGQNHRIGQKHRPKHRPKPSARTVSPAGRLK